MKKLIGNCICVVLFFFFLDVDHFKSLIGFVTVLLLFYILVLWPPDQGLNTVPPGVEGQSPNCLTSREFPALTQL